MDLNQPIENNEQEVTQSIFSKKFGIEFTKQGVGLFAVCMLILIGFFFVIRRANYTPPRPAYAAAYNLVSDTVSKSAAIVIYLPKGVTREAATGHIQFTPNINGSWQVAGNIQQLIYKPLKPLITGRHYSVTLETPAGTIGKDFLVDDDPEVAAFFPSNDSETNEKSSVTVVFNRPMVPLSTLDVLKNDQMPVVVTPNTPGKYKWVGTRTVQFIPTDRLIRSSHYTVSVAPGMVSIDGLAVKSAEAHFITRPLRYEYVTDGNQPLVYNQPITIQFNQPVDLARTTKEISVQNAANNSVVEIVVEYGTTQKYNEVKKVYEKIQDQSILNVYQAHDSHGRAKLWDFTNRYNFAISKAYPTEGDINLDEPRGASVGVTDVIADVSAVSDRSSLVTPQFFDSEGKLVVRFYEPISINESEIKASELASVSYAQRCAEGTDSQGDQQCPKVPDHQVLELRFNSNNLNQNQDIAINFNRIINDSRFKINFSPITVHAKTVPALALLRSYPAHNSSGASVSDLILCTNSPLVMPERKDIGNYLTVSPEYEFKVWRQSFLVTNPYPGADQCLSGEFQTNINYGLMPTTDYQVSLNLQDHFGSKTNTKLHFVTGEMPSMYLNFYHFQKEYNVTTPALTKLTYGAENMEYVDVTACKLGAENMLSKLAHKPMYTEGPGAITGCIDSVSKRVPLPKRYWIKNYFTVDIKDYFPDPIGHYILTFSNANYLDQSVERKQVFERTYLTVTRLSVVQKKIEVWDKSIGLDDKDKLGDARRKSLSNLYWVADLTTLDPVVGAQVGIYTVTRSGDYSTFTKANNAITNDSGIATAPPLSEQNAIIVTNGSDSAVSYDESRLNYADTALSLSKLYVYTDRPLYRPGHTVNIKGIYRVGYDGAFNIAQGKPVTVKVFDTAQKEIFTQSLTVNDFGTFNATTTLPLDAPLGTYRIEIDGRGFGYFDVEEYVPSAFQVEAKSDHDEYIAGDTMKVGVDAAYYFGVQLEGGTVDYSIVSQNYYFDKYQGDYFQFGRDWYGCYDDCAFGDKFITRGSGVVDATGKASITEKLDFQKWFPRESDRSSKLITLYITVTNSRGQAVSTRKSFIVHAGEYYLGLNTASSFAAKGQPITVNVKSVSTLGEEMSVSGATLSYGRVRWVSNKRQGLDGGYYYSWEKKLESVREQKMSTDSHGNASNTFTPDKEGEYEVSIRGVDRRGNSIVASYILYVYGDQPVADLRPSNDNSLDLVVKQPKVNVGDTATFLIKSPYDHAKALISIERGNVYHYEVVDVKPGFYVYHFPITLGYVPNVYASVVLLSDKPEVRYGRASYSVDTKVRDLAVTVTSDKQNYLPGEDVVLNFTAKNSAGEPVAAEFSAAVVDMSVLALKGNPKKNPVMFFYDGFPLTVATLSNVKNILYKVDLPIGTKGGGGGGDASDLSRKKRGEFRDTAYWNAVIRTDANGQAKLRFTLPDNLTEWQVEAVGVTKDTLVGTGYSEFKTNKNIMAVPLKPRFILPGDQFMIGATVFNRSNKKQTLQASFQSDTLVLNDKKKQQALSIPAGESRPVYFAVTAPADRIDGTHHFVISVKNAAYEDTVEEIIPIKRNDTYETTATAGYSTNLTTRESLLVPSATVVGKGSITVKTSATLAVFLADGLKYMLDFPYDSCEQIGSKLETIAILKRASQLKNMSGAFPVTEVPWHNQMYPVDKAVSLGLSALYARQNPDGGFFYYPRYYSYHESSLYLSLHIARVFAKVKAAGFAVDDERVRRLYQYIINAEARGTGYGPYDDNTEVLIASALNDLKEYGNLSGAIIDRLRKLASNNAFLAEHSSNLVLAKLYLVLTDKSGIFGAGASTKVLKTLDNRIQIDARGAYLEPGKNLFWEYYETPVFDTALYLQVAARAKHKNEVTDRLLRWIIASRAKDGSWGSTINTLGVIDAFTDYLIATKENESDFSLTTSLNGAVVGTGRFATSTVLSQNTLTIPLSGLPRDVLIPLQMQKINNNNLLNTMYYDVALRYFLPVEALPPRDEGFAITRGLYKSDDANNERPLVEGKVGDVLRVHDEIIVSRSRNYVAVEDFIPAGAEIVNTNLATSDQSLGMGNGNPTAAADRPTVLPLYASTQESRDDRLYVAVEHLSPGTYSVDYYIRLLVPGVFQHLPAVVSENYFPENFGRTGGGIFTITQ